MNYNNVLYVRSANNSKDPLYLQKKSGVHYAKQNSLHLSIIENLSSGNTPLNERSGLSLLLHLIELGRVKTIIVDAHYRISRSSVVLSYFFSITKAHNVKLIVLDGGDHIEK